MTDPSGRNNKNSSPPDLEELLRQIGVRLRSSPGSPGSGGRIAGIAALVIVLLWLASGFHIVHEGERGVVLRFGELARVEPSGLHWRMPYPIDELFIVNVEGVRTIEIGYRNRPSQKVPEEALMLTEEENIVDVQFAIQYALADAADYLFSMIDPDETVRHAAESAIREVAGRHDMDFVLYEGRTALASEVKSVLQTLLDRYQSGIRIASVTMQNAQPPEEVQPAFDDAVKASQDRERQINEAEAYRNDVVPKARGMASRVVEEAEGYREKIVSEAEGDTARFRHLLAAYDKNQQLMRQRLYLETMEEILAKNPKVIGKTDILPLLQLSDHLSKGAAQNIQNKKTTTTEIHDLSRIAFPEENVETSRDRSMSYREREGR